MKNDNVFENSVEIYDEWFLKNNYIFNSEVEAIRLLLDTTGEGVEIGVGTGIFASRLGIKHGVEPAQKMRKKAIERGIDAVNGFAENLPIKDGIYQYALMITVDCFLKDINKAFKEVWRILSNGGIFIIAFIDMETPLGRLYDEHKYSDNFYKYAQFHSAEEIIKLLEMNRFKILDKKQTIYTLENKTQEIKDGVGEGVFAVIKAKKI